VPWSLGERARGAEHDTARAVVLAVGCQGARRRRDDGGSSELHGRPWRARALELGRGKGGRARGESECGRGTK
jgi:hypothetical protein